VFTDGNAEVGMKEWQMNPAIPLDPINFSDDYAIDPQFDVQTDGTIAPG